MRLEEISEAIVDCEHKTAPAGDGFALSVGTRAMKSGRLVLDACKPVSERTYVKWSRRMTPQPGDLVLAREAPVGQVVVVPETPKICLGQRTVLIRPDAAQVHPRFLHYWLLGPDAQSRMAEQAAGATVPHLNVSDIRGLDVSQLPQDPRNQQVVAEVLGAIDDLIENNRRRVEVLEEMARTIYREWFVHFRFPGHEDATFVDSDLGRTPERWVLRAASEALDIKPRLKVHGSDEHPFVTMGDISETGMWCQYNEQRTGSSGAKFQNWDTLFARITPCLQNGKTALVMCLDGEAIGRGSTEFITMRGKSVGPMFTYCLARSSEFRGHAIASMSGASGRQRVRDECFDAFQLASPPVDLAREFESCTAPMAELIRDLSRASEQLRAIRDVLLPKLVTGQIDVSDLNLDAASEQAVA